MTFLDVPNLRYSDSTQRSECYRCGYSVSGHNSNQCPQCLVVENSARAAAAQEGLLKQAQTAERNAQRAENEARWAQEKAVTAEKNAIRKVAIKGYRLSLFGIGIASFLVILIASLILDVMKVLPGEGGLIGFLIAIGSAFVVPELFIHRLIKNPSVGELITKVGNVSFKFIGGLFGLIIILVVLRDIGNYIKSLF